MRNKRTTRANVIVVIAVFALVTLGAVLLNAHIENARFEHAFSLPTSEVVVHQGDTIDGIANKNPVVGLSDHELGYVIAQINADNPNMSSPLRPGDRIFVPQESDRI